MRKGLFYNRVKKLAMTTLAVALIALSGLNRANAEILPQYELTSETEGIEAFEVEVATDKLNVRLGWGTGYERLTYNGEFVVLHKGDKVAGMSKGKAPNGGEWYEIRWTDNGVPFHGYVYAGYTKLTGQAAYNIPTPTPTPTPTNTPTPTPTPTNTPIPTPTATPVPEEPEKDSVNPGTAVGIVLFLLVVIGGGYYWFKTRNKNMPSEAADDKIKKLKHATERAEIIERERKLYAKDKKKTDKPEDGYDRRNEFDDDYEMNPNPIPEEEKSAIAAAVREKEELKKTLEGLKYNDVVIHKYFGEGVVIDNADVNNVEVRFNDGEVRYINKESAASKRIMMKL